MSRVRIFALNNRQYYCCADFGRKNDVAVAVISKHNGDGSSTVVATKVLGRASGLTKKLSKKWSRN